MPKRATSTGSPKVYEGSPKVANYSQGRQLTTLFAGARRDFLDELAMQVKMGSRSAGTLWTYEKVLEFFERQMGVQTLEQVTRPLVNNFLLGLRDGNLPDSRKPASDSYVARNWRHLVAFLKWARRRGYDTDPGLWEGERFSVPQPYVEEIDPELYVWQEPEIEAIREVARVLGARERLIVELLLRTGIRPSELVRLELDDVQGANLRVRASKSRRGRLKPLRWPPLPKPLQQMIAAYVAKHRPASPSERLILRQDGLPLTYFGLDSLLGRIHAKAGVSGSAYTYRHTFATYYLRRNPGQIEKLREIMGHEDFKTLRRYATLSRVDLAANADEEDPFREGR